jgi:hypothetical protein
MKINLYDSKRTQNRPIGIETKMFHRTPNAKKEVNKHSNEKKQYKSKRPKNKRT